jgi:hypothetical protein
MFGAIRYYIHYDMVVSFIAAGTLVFVVWVVARLIQSRRTEKLRAISPSIGVIPLLAGLIAATGFLTEIIDLFRAISAISRTGTGDPQVLAAGFVEAFFGLTVTGILFFFFLEAWLVIRMFYLKFINELEPLSEQGGK